MIHKTMTIKQYMAKAAGRKAKREQKRLELGLPARGDRPKKAPRRSERKTLVGQLDALFSEYIRTKAKRSFGGECPFSHKDGRRHPVQHCFHFITRAKYSVRWDPRNAIGSCAGCNLENEYNPHRFIDWFIKAFGQQKFSVLVRDSNRLARFSNEDLRQIRPTSWRSLRRF